MKKRSPNAPSISLSDAIDRVRPAFDKEGVISLPNPVIAEHLGYSSATSGASLGMIAALKYYGLLESAVRGELNVARDFQDYVYNPDNNERLKILQKWALAPKVFNELAEKFPDSLPSDNALVYHLINMGFKDKAAHLCANNFKETVSMAKIYDEEAPALDRGGKDDLENHESESQSIPSNEPGSIDARGVQMSAPLTTCSVGEAIKIPIRLSGKRVAYLQIPESFYERDKETLKRHIDVMIADDE